MKSLVNKLLIYSFMLFTTFSCSYAQKKDENSPKPRVHIDVKKETDEHGNIIHYDSTYTWSWSNVDTIIDFRADSMFSHFFRKNWQRSFDFDSLFFSPFSFSPFDDDWMNIDKQIEKMFQLQNEMFKRHEEIMKKFFQPDVLIPAPNQPNDQFQNNKKQQRSQSNSNQGLNM